MGPGSNNYHKIKIWTFPVPHLCNPIWLALKLPDSIFFQHGAHMWTSVSARVTSNSYHMHVSTMLPPRKFVRTGSRDGWCYSGSGRPSKGYRQHRSWMTRDLCMARFGPGASHINRKEGAERWVVDVMRKRLIQCQTQHLIRSLKDDSVVAGSAGHVCRPLLA